MSEWKEYKLGEIVSWGNGKERPKDKGAIPVYGGNGVLDYTNRNNYDGETVIVGRVGAYCGSVYYSNIPIWVSDNALAAKPKNGNDTKFLYYFLLHLNLNGYAEGSTHPLVTQRLLNSIDVTVPPIEEQRRIAGVLGALDEKIDLLNRENATLEALAETLFRHHFIENPDPDWKEGRVSMFADHSKESINPQKHPDKEFLHYSIPAYDAGQRPTVELGSEIQSNKYIIPHNCILFSKLNPHKDKRVWLMLDKLQSNAICSTEFQIVKPKNDKWLYFLYGWLTYKDNYDEIASGVSGTSGSHQRIDPKVIFDNECSLVDDEIVVQYNVQVKPMFEKIKTNQQQILSLSSQRDTLLPRLMSGEVKLDE